MTRWMGAVLVACSLMASSALAQAPDEPTPAVPLEAQLDALGEQLEELDQQADAAGGEAQLDQIEQQIAELERKRMDLEQMAERIHAFAEVRQDARMRLQDLRAELKELQEEMAEVEEVPPAMGDLQAARLEHLSQAIETTSKIAALQRPTDLPTAMQLLRELDLHEMKWNVVLEPKLMGALQIAEMQNEAAELGNPPQLTGLIQQAREFHEKAVADAETLYDLWVAQVKARETFGRHVDEFWQTLQRHEAAAEAEEEG